MRNVAFFRRCVLAAVVSIAMCLTSVNVYGFDDQNGISEATEATEMVETAETLTDEAVTVVNQEQNNEYREETGETNDKTSEEGSEEPQAGSVEANGEESLDKAVAEDNVSDENNQEKVGNDTDEVLFEEDKENVQEASDKPAAEAQDQETELCDADSTNNLTGASRPRTTRIIIEQEGATEKNGVYILWGKGMTMQLKPRSLPSNALQGNYTYASSQPTVATVDSNGLITATANYSIPCHISVTANDGSGVKFVFKLKIVQKVVSLDVEPANGYGDLAAGCSCKFKVTFNKGESIPMCRRVFWSAYEKQGEEFVKANDVVMNQSGELRARNPVPDGKKIYVKATTLEAGSDVESDYYEVTLHSTPTYKMLFKDSSDNLITGKYIDICAGEPIGRFRKYYKIGIRTEGRAGTTEAPCDKYTIISSYSRIASVEYVEDQIIDGEPYTGYLVKANEEGRVGNVTLIAKACDGSNRTSRMGVRVVNPVREVSVTSTSKETGIINGTYRMYRATVNRNATNKRIKWSLVEQTEDNTYTDATEKAKSEGLKVSASGILYVDRYKSVPTLESGNHYYVMASAMDLSDSYSVVPFTVYPATRKVNIELDTDRNNEQITVSNKIPVGGETYLSISSDPSGTMNKYLIQYNGGAGSFEVLDANGTSVKIKGIRKGTFTVKASTLDGSRRVAYYRITVK